MKKLLLLGALLSGSYAHANTLFSSELVTSGNSVTVDHWYFTVTEAGQVSIETTNLQQVQGYDLDTVINLYLDDGSLSIDDHVYSDDDGGARLASHLNYVLSAGDYVALVGDYSLPMYEFGAFKSSPGSDDGLTYDIVFSDRVKVTTLKSGNLDGSFTSTLIAEAAVPLPGAMFFFGAGLIGLAGLRRKV